MPYNKINDLPKSISNHLPKHAQEIFKEAFNAWEEYKEPKDRKGIASREETSFKVAWAAVKKTYHKEDSDNWTKD
jgi:cation transport regulator